MKILWVKSDFLHPTNRGGQIRTLETLRRLHRRHEIHYVAYDDPLTPEGVARSSEYCSQAYPVRQTVPRHYTPAFFAQLARNLFSPLPLAVGRYCSPAMRRRIADVRREHDFDAVVADFLSTAPNIPDLESAVLFQHNVESVIWRRHAEHASSWLRRTYFQMQAKRMLACEGDVCRRVKHIVAVSANDARTMRDLFGVSNVSEVPTGVDLDFFHAPEKAAAPVADLVFVGSMAWLPNIDGAVWFTREILPLIRARRPQCSLAIVGREPVPEVVALAKSDPLIQVTGTLPDIRPYLWGSAVSIVPLRVGGGTRLKIFEAMAAGVPVVSTAVGAEGLDVGADIRIADTPELFAQRCLELLENDAERARLSASALNLVRSRFSWDRSAEVFEEILERTAPSRPIEKYVSC